MKTKKNVLWYRVGLGEKWLHSSMRNTLMEEKVSSFHGTNDTERSTKMRCCITLIKARKERSLNINQSQFPCQNVTNLTSHPRQPEVPNKRYASDDNLMAEEFIYFAFIYFSVWFSELFLVSQLNSGFREVQYNNWIVVRRNQPDEEVEVRVPCLRFLYRLSFY